MAGQADGPAPWEGGKKLLFSGFLRTWDWSEFSEVLKMGQRSLYLI